MMKSTALFLAAVLSLHAADEWPQFRGPAGDGHSAAKGLPTELGEGTHVKWKTPIHGKAWSSPVISDDRIWLTTATEDGTELGLVSLDRESGKVLLDKKLFTVAAPQFCHKFNSYASPTPVIEGQRLYVSFGSPGIGCINTKTGELIWERRDFVCNHFRGAGSSPVVWRHLLILTFDGSDHQFITAIDKATGKTVWEVQRSVDYKDLLPDGRVEADGDWRKGFGTPHVADLAGQPVLFSSGAKAHYAYEPATGKEIWRWEERGGHSPAARPVLGDGLIFITPGFGAKQVVALKLGKSGLLDESAIAWREKKSAPNKPSLILAGPLLFCVDDAGMATCFDAATGSVHWRERIGGNYSASPMIAEGRLYFFSEEGKVVVLEAAAKFNKIAEGKFDDGFMASPAVAGSALFLRTKTALYRVEN